MTRARSRSTARILAGGLLMLLVAGCNLFKPAEPQAPAGSSGGNVVAVDYTSPAATLATLAAAVGAKSRGNGLTAYSRAFADPVADGIGFTATFDPDVARAYELSSGLPLPTWTLELEEDFYSAFAGLRSNPYALRWTPYQEHGNDEIDDAAGQAILHRRYVVLVANSDGVFSDSIAVGITDLTLRRFGNRWAITVWEDLVDPDLGSEPLNDDHRSMGDRRLESR